MAARKTAIAPSSAPTAIATLASNAGCGPHRNDTPATIRVSRMPSSATASSSSTARTVVLLRFLAMLFQPPNSRKAMPKVNDSSASENSNRPSTSNVNGSMTLGLSSA